MGTIRISLTQGKYALIDADDWPVVSPYRWYAARRGTCWYANANAPNGSRHPPTISMHRLLLGFQYRQIDHRSGDGLDNRRANLRPCDDSTNQANRHRLATNTSGFRGVTFNKKCSKWQAQIKHQGRNIYLGVFASAEDAARAYDRRAVAEFGPFARVNFPAQGDQAA